MASIIDIYKMTDLREENLWKNAIFVFDSSALLDFYYYPKKEREKIFSDVFKKISERLWIPSHVEYEYLKNRESVIKKPIQEKYEPIENDVKNMTVEINNLMKQVTEIVKKTIKEDKHPYVNQSKISIYKEHVNKLVDLTKEFEKDFLEEITLSKDEIYKMEDNDDIYNSIYEYFKVGPEFKFNKIIEITKEGKHRYEFRIPPGYGDLYKNKKQGTQIFGDLIIWKQILEYSQKEKCSIIFITNDTTKDNDWCYIDSRNRILSPREELIKEINDYSNVEFWMYNQPQFLFLANKYLNSSIKEETIKDISNLLNTQYTSVQITLFSLLVKIYNKLVIYYKIEDFTRIDNNNAEEISSLIKEYKKEIEKYPKEKQYAEYFEKQKSLLTEISSLNYYIHYEEIRMKRDTIEQEKRLKKAIIEFCDVYIEQEEEYIDYMIDMYENRNMNDGIY